MDDIFTNSSRLSREHVPTIIHSHSRQLSGNRNRNSQMPSSSQHSRFEEDSTLTFNSDAIGTEGVGTISWNDYGPLDSVIPTAQSTDVDVNGLDDRGNNDNQENVTASQLQEEIRLLIDRENMEQKDSLDLATRLVRNDAHRYGVFDLEDDNYSKEQTNTNKINPDFACAYESDEVNDADQPNMLSLNRIIEIQEQEMIRLRILADKENWRASLLLAERIALNDKE